METLHCVETNPDLGEKNQLQLEPTGPMPEPHVCTLSGAGATPRLEAEPFEPLPEQETAK